MVAETNFDGLMNVLVITITKKRLIFFIDTYEVTILYTPYKQRIYKIITDYEKLPFEIGDNINKVMDWSNKNKYEYFNRDKNEY